MNSQQVDELIQNELIKTALDPFDLASDLNLQSLPDNLNLIVQQLTAKLSEIFHVGKRKMSNSIFLLPIDQIQGNSMKEFFSSLNQQVITNWYQQQYPQNTKNINCNNNLNISNSLNNNTNHNDISHKYGLRNKQKLITTIKDQTSEHENIVPQSNCIIEFLGNLPLMFPPENQYYPKFVKRRRGRPRTRLNIYEKLLSKDDLSAINALNQLSTPFFNINNLVSRIETLGLDMISATLLELVTQNNVSEALSVQFITQIERTTINMREFKEQLYKMIFLKYGPLIDKEISNWTQNQQRMIESSQNELNEDRKYTWFYQIFLILYKLKIRNLKMVNLLFQIYFAE